MYRNMLENSIRVSRNVIHRTAWHSQRVAGPAVNYPSTQTCIMLFSVSTFVFFLGNAQTLSSFDRGAELRSCAQLASPTRRFNIRTPCGIAAEHPTHVFGWDDRAMESLQQRTRRVVQKSSLERINMLLVISTMEVIAAVAK